MVWLQRDIYISNRWKLIHPISMGKHVVYNSSTQFALRGSPLDSQGH